MTRSAGPRWTVPMPPPGGSAAAAVLTPAVRGAAPASVGAAASRPAARATPRAPLTAGRRRMVGLMVGPPRLGDCPRLGAVPVRAPPRASTLGPDRPRPATWSVAGRSQGSGVPAAFPPLAARPAGTQDRARRAGGGPSGEAKRAEPCRADTPARLARCPRPRQGPWSLSRGGPGWQGRAGGGRTQATDSDPRDHGERRAGRAPHLHSAQPDDTTTRTSSPPS